MAATTLVLLILCLAGASSESAGRNYHQASFDLVRRILTDKPWLDRAHWERPPRDPYLTGSARGALRDENSYYNSYDVLRSSSEKRSAVATALNAGRRRRQPSPALGKDTLRPYVGVGVLNNMETFFDSLRDNLETLAYLSPEQRTTMFQEPPTVVHAPSSGGDGGRVIGKLHALRPLRPASNIRSYNRRSFMEADGAYPGAYNHDPELLWTGLGR